MINSTDCLLVMGRRGCGKSYLAKNLQKLWPRRVIIDSLNEYQEGITVKSFDKFCDELIKLQDTKEFVLIFRFDPENTVSETEFNHILRICYHFGNIQVVIEEIQLYSSPHTCPHWLKNCLLTGRHQNLSLMFTTQRPGELNKTVLSQCSHIFCGTIVEGNDLRYISSFLNQSAQKLSSLKPRTFLYFSDQGVKVIKNSINLK